MSCYKNKVYSKPIPITNVNLNVSNVSKTNASLNIHFCLSTTFTEYSPRRWFFLHYISFCTSALGVIFLLLNRGHYSIDCLIAYWMTTRVWWMFHTLANHEAMKDIEHHNSNNSNPNNYLKRAWWWSGFRYFERNVPTNLPLQFNWPIPKKVQDSRPVQYIKRKCGMGDNDDSLRETRYNLLSSRTVTGYSTIPDTTSQNE